MDESAKTAEILPDSTTSRVLAAVSGIEGIAIGARSAADAVAGDVANHAGRLGAVETGLADLHAVVNAAAAVDGGGGLLQEIVDFLHRLFPGHGAPGVPGGGKPSVPPA